MPDLTQLRAFVTVAEERNFTRAGERLHVAQQAVSKSIATLEAQLGVKLLNRTTRNVTLTPAGEMLFRSGVDALQRVDSAFAEATARGRGLTGTLELGVTAAVGAVMYPPIAAALTAGAPKLHVTFHELRPTRAAERLRRDELDLVVSRTGPESGEFSRAELAASPAIAIVPIGHHLARRGRVEVGDLDGETLLVWEPAGTPYTDDLVRRLAAGGARPEIEVARVIGGGGTPSLDDGQFALRPIGWPTIDAVALEFEPPGLELPLWVYWPPGWVDPAVERLREHLGPGAHP